MFSIKQAKRYCKNYKFIKNYECAVNSDEKYVIHHLKEDVGFTKKQLIEMGLYYNRPYQELVFLKNSEHIRHHRIGKKHTEDSRKKMSESKKGCAAWNKGCHHSQETKEKIRKANTNPSEYTRNKMSLARIGDKGSKAKKVEQIDKKTKSVLGVWNCIKFAAEATNISAACISQCCRGISKTAGGFIWRYAS